MSGARHGVLAALGLVVLLGCVSGGDHAGPIDASPPHDAVSDRDGAGDAARFEDAPPMACARDGDCRASRGCVAEAGRAAADLVPLPLACGVPGAGTDEHGRCDTSSQCARGICVLAGTCVRPCAENGDCGSNERCALVFARTGPSASQPLRACVRIADAPSGADMRSERRVDGLRRGTQDVELPGVRSVMDSTVLVVDGEPALVRLELLSSATAAPQVLFPFGPEPGSPERVPVLSTGVPLTVLLPNGPLALLTEDGYRATLVADRSADLRVTRVSRAGGGRILDLDLYYVGGGGLRSTPLGPPERIGEAIEQATTLLGLALGDVRQHDIGGQLRERFSVLDSEHAPDELEALFRLSAGAGRPSVNLFLVRSLGVAMGASGGIPGPPAMHGTGGSGIAMPIDVFEGAPPSTLAEALAHELGHYLGLFHTTERDGLVLEALPDTPECPDAHADGVVLPEECEGAGADNLMFWAPGGHHLSAQQQAVLDRALVLR